jgi:hypothetical protein
MHRNLPQDRALRKNAFLCSGYGAKGDERMFQPNVENSSGVLLLVAG